MQRLPALMSNKVFPQTPKRPFMHRQMMTMVSGDGGDFSKALRLLLSRKRFGLTNLPNPELWAYHASMPHCAPQQTQNHRLTRLI